MMWKTGLLNSDYSLSKIPRNDVCMGTVVQIDPEADEGFGGCFLTVRAVRSWGVDGTVKVPSQTDIQFMARWDQIKVIGRDRYNYEYADDESEEKPQPESEGEQEKKNTSEEEATQ
jgi:hypothetical protein